MLTLDLLFTILKMLVFTRFGPFRILEKPPGKSFQHSNSCVLCTFQLLGKVLVPFPAHSRQEKVPGITRHPSFLTLGIFGKILGKSPKTQMKEHKRKIKNNSYSKKSGRFLLLLQKKNGHEFVWALETTEQGTFRFFHEVST